MTGDGGFCSDREPHARTVDAGKRRNTEVGTGTEQVTLTILSNDGDTAIAFCREHNRTVTFNRGAVSKEKFLKDLVVGRTNQKCDFIPDEVA